MPAWFTATLITAAVLALLWWAETRAATIIAELKAIHEDLDKLCSYGVPDDEDDDKVA